MSTAVKAVNDAASSNSISSDKTTSIISTIFQVIGSLVSGGLFVVSFIMLSKFLGNSDKWNAIQGNLSSIFIYTAIAPVCLMIVAAIYFISDDKLIIWFVMIILCLSLIMSYTALYLSVIN